ncbi:MAG: glycosyltransferase [Coprothermobacterota bacterium]|nr:glycosyltransferase [Coprothermobacterota bacterium]
MKIRPDPEKYFWLYYFYPLYLVQRPHHISIGLSELGDELIWFRPPRSALGYLFDRDIKGLLKALLMKPRLETIELIRGKEIKIFHPRGFYPLPRHLLPKRILVRIKRSLLKQTKNLLQPDFILLGWSVLQDEIILLRSLFPNTKIIFDVVDDIPGFHENSSFLRDAFFQTLAEADGIISINQAILTKYSRWIKAPSIIIPNGVFFEEPPGFALNNTAKIVGYFGAFDFWFDFESLAKIASMLPKTQFLLVGPCPRSQRQRMEKVLKLPNIIYHGPVPFEQIPNILKKIDVLLIPWLPLEVSQLADPIKIKEALYAGIPVIYFNKTGDPEIDSKIIITSDLSEIVQIIRNNSLPDPGLRKQWAELIAQNYSWKVLVNKLRKFCIELSGQQI